MSTLRQNLAFLMSKHQLTANTLAKETGVPQPTISRILSGESSDPRDATLLPLAEKFNLSIENLRSENVEGAEEFLLTEPRADIVVQIGARPQSTNQRLLQRIRSATDQPHIKPGTKGLYVERARQARDYIDGLLMPCAKPTFEGFHDTYNFDHESTRLVLSWAVVSTKTNFGRLPEIGPNRSAMESRLWRLSSYKLETEEQYPTRQYIYAIVFLDLDSTSDDPADWFPPVTQMNSLFVRMAAQAGLHGVTFMQMTPETLVSTVSKMNT